MLETEKDSKVKIPPPYHLRRMCKEDIAQITQIDREAFPTMWPPVNFRHELDNRLAHYIVVYGEEERTPEPVKPEQEPSGLAHRIKQLFRGSSSRVAQKAPLQYIMGFIGIWMMADEAHIINIAVREQCRQQGLGELLLIAGLDLAYKLKASIMTLEVRKSNVAAHKLYEKYGFVEVGVRRGYYTDNKEDALLMSTEGLALESFQARLRKLKEAHLADMGTVNYDPEALSTC
ncbi:MAG: ribosomal protein S18-alanine N-acetyltransferase [Dehalococcoidia bacterium]|nr:ribosomal protein S18-alanine N-acetyltransferase [Dehalococcoidia bacterium]